MPDAADNSRTARRTVAVLGASGFVGRAVVSRLGACQVGTRTLTAPRLRFVPADLDRLNQPLTGQHRRTIEVLAGQLDGAEVVVNAAGLPDGTAPASPALYGANALLPVLVARACALSGVKRFIHLSSAAVQGPTALDETSRTVPFSPYSHSKALGERLLLREDTVSRVLFRSTWVHASGRANTRSLVRLARSPMSCVAGDGSAPTPQVLVEDIADSVAHLALTAGPVPQIVLQPSNGMTTGLLLWLLGGHEPRRLPRTVAHATARGLRTGARLGQRANAYARRFDMLLFGKRQVPGWLAEQGLAPTLRPEVWQRLAAEER